MPSPVAGNHSSEAVSAARQEKKDLEIARTVCKVAALVIGTISVTALITGLICLAAPVAAPLTLLLVLGGIGTVLLTPSLFAGYHVVNKQLQNLN